MGRPLAGANVFQAIADPTRRRLLELLADNEQPVGSLLRPFRFTQPALSQHLRVLRQAGLVTRRRVGRQQLYRLNARPLEEVHDWAGRYERFWREKLDTLGEYLERHDER